MCSSSIVTCNDGQSAVSEVSEASETRAAQSALAITKAAGMLAGRLQGMHIACFAPVTPRPHLHRDWAHPATSAPGLGPPCHICTGTGPTLPHLHRDWAHPATSAPYRPRPCHICTGTGHGRYPLGLEVVADLVKLLLLLLVVFALLRRTTNLRGIPRGRFGGK
jgi:hypothetical protein